MTGWAAINGSRGPLHQPSEVRRRVALDVDYIDRQSFWFDVKIMLLTIPSFFGDSAVVR
jgi:lipopolysaccharide/colanic/teichoic acid biosynthesis glycosyltransferase